MTTKGPPLAQPLRRLIAAWLGQGRLRRESNRMRRSMALAVQLRWRSVRIGWRTAAPWIATLPASDAVAEMDPGREPYPPVCSEFNVASLAFVSCEPGRPWRDAREPTSPTAAMSPNTTCLPPAADAKAGVGEKKQNDRPTANLCAGTRNIRMSQIPS